MALGVCRWILSKDALRIYGQAVLGWAFIEICLQSLHADRWVRKYYFPALWST